MSRLVDDLGNTPGDIALSFNDEESYRIIRDAGLRSGCYFFSSFSWSLFTSSWSQNTSYKSCLRHHLAHHQQFYGARMMVHSVLQRLFWMLNSSFLLMILGKRFVAWFLMTRQSV
jgi:hypothetical protein